MNVLKINYSIPLTKLNKGNVSNTKKCHNLKF